VLVYHDLLGLEERIAPRFVRRYAELGRESREQIERFAADVRGRRFPSAQESYGGGSGGARPAAEDAAQRIYG
jgi:3-methyl-2-oxobutanoate hydroxymethyltransferase